MLNARDELEKFKFDHSDSLLQSSRVLITSSPFDAKNYIESARKLCRENPIVEELDEIIRKNSDPKHLTERYDSLIEPSALRLALEIYKMRTLDKIPWYNPFRTKARAEIYNFIGFMDLYFGFRCDEIYNLIEKYLTESIRLRADWYLPHENLGDLYSSLGRYDHGDKRTKLMRKSIIEHETALEKAKKELDNDLQELRTVQNRINISKALARLRVPDNTEMINIANKEINSIYIYILSYKI
jgi:hypothetical protein